MKLSLPSLPSLPSRSVLLLLSLVFWVIPARAIEEFFSIPDATTGQPASTWASTLATDGYSYRTYESFSLSSDAHITQVTWTGVYIDEIPGAPVPPPAQTTTWRIGFFTNVAGQPGAQVHSVDMPAANVTSVAVSDEVYGENGNPLARRRYTANLPTPAVLASGTTYWFSPLSLQPNYNPHFSWWMGTESGDCFQHLTQPPTDFTRPNNRAFTLRGEFPPPPVALKAGAVPIASGGTHSFPATELGQSQTVVFTLTNNGDRQVTAIAAAIAPGGHPDFNMGAPPPSVSLHPGVSTSIRVVFAPQTPGARAATLSVTSSGAPSPYLVLLTGSATDTTVPLVTTAAPTLSVVDGAVNFDATITAWLNNHGGAVVTDASGSVTWAHNYSGFPPIPGTSATITFTATDPSNNSSTTAAQLIVLDQTPPVITSQAAGLTVVCDAPDKLDMVNAWLAAHGTAAATDNSGTFTWSHNFTALPAACGVVTVTFKATDPSGNFSTSQAQLTVQDNTAPAITNAATGLTVESDGLGNITARTAWLNNHGGATATDTCTTVSWSHNFTGLANTLPQTVPVTFTASDACGHSTPTSANFIIQDTTPPQVTVAAKDYYGDCDNAAASIAAFLASHGSATAVDIAGPINWSSNYNGTLPNCKGYITVTFTATDTVGLTASTSCRFFLFPPGAIWIGAATGTWATASNWHPQLPTATLDTYVDLFPFQNTTLTSGFGAAVKNLFISQGDSLSIIPSSSFFGSYLEISGSTVSNAGTLLLESSGLGAGESVSLYVTGGVSLEGNGKMFLKGPGRNTVARGNESATDVLTVASTHEIVVTGGALAGLSNTSIRAGLINHGTLTTDGGGVALLTEPKTNNGTFRSLNGGNLQMEVPITNSNGTLFIDGTSVMDLRSTLTGGQVIGTGRLLTAGGTLKGPMTLGTGLSTAAKSGSTILAGSITNNGVITLGTPDAEGTGYAFLDVDGPVTLSGGGKLIIQGSSLRRINRGNEGATDILTLQAGQEIIAGPATIAGIFNTSMRAGLINNGTVTADQGGIALITEPKTNNGTFRAIRGGSLIIEASLLNYNSATGTLSGGRYEVISEGTATTMDIQSSPIATIAGGTTVRLSGANAAVAQLSSLQNISGTLTLENGKTLATSGNMAVPGKLHYGLPATQNTTRLNITGNANFPGGTVDITDLGMTSGSYILATWTGSVTGAPALGIRPPGMTHNLVVDAAAKQLRLEVFVIPQVNITAWTVVPGTGSNAGQNVVTLGGTGHPHASYVLQATTDLQIWTALSGILTSPTGAISWQFTEPATLARRYYRFLPQ